MLRQPAITTSACGTDKFAIPLQHADEFVMQRTIEKRGALVDRSVVGADGRSPAVERWLRVPIENDERLIDGHRDATLQRALCPPRSYDGPTAPRPCVVVSAFVLLRFTQPRASPLSTRFDTFGVTTTRLPRLGTLSLIQPASRLPASGVQSCARRQESATMSHFGVHGSLSSFRPTAQRHDGPAHCRWRPTRRRRRRFRRLLPLRRRQLKLVPARISAC
ncbi:hypothetical protein PJI17_01425 [Mycobacterium kansasii]